MNGKKQIFWTEALKGGTVIGLLSVAFSIVMQASGEMTTLTKILNVASTVVMVILAFGFTRRLAMQSDPREGFSMGRAVGFVVAMLAISGVLTGIYTAVMANFFIHDELMKTVDEMMAGMQDTIPADSFEQTYELMRKGLTSPLLLTLSSVFSNSLLGVLCGVCVGFVTRRQPNIFAPIEEENNMKQE
ncbi:MAG: DUF4199 domain-containing protein [Tidjanibacter sp.]|nr:DUF4199 domain-containing protein [Tidjanibacter sp.]